MHAEQDHEAVAACPDGFSFYPHLRTADPLDYSPHDGKLGRAFDSRALPVH